MTNFGIFGPVVTTNTVEQAVMTLCEVWLPTYIEVVIETMGLTAGSIAYPQSFQNSYDFDNYAEWLLPALVVVCDGTLGEFERDGSGEIGAWFNFDTAMLVNDQTEASTRKLASLYASAIALMLEQRGSLGGLSDKTVTTKIETRLPEISNRSLALGQVNAETFVNSIMNSLAGAPSGADPAYIEPALPYPLSPYADATNPYPDWPVVEVVGTSVDGEAPSD